MNTAKSFRTRVAIADDHKLVCAAVAELLQADPRLEVVAQVHDGAGVEALLKRRDLEVLVLDLQMPGKHGLELLKLFNGNFAVCVLSAHTEAHFVIEAVRAGANGYVSKAAAAEELVQALLAIAQGDSYYSPDVKQTALSLTTKINRDRLTGREQEVLRLCATGLASATVGVKLGISRRTAETHRASLMKKLSLKSQTDLVRYALRQGIISLDSGPFPGGLKTEAR